MPRLSLLVLAACAALLFGFGEGDEEEEELSGAYRLTAEISVQDGEARVYSYDAEGDRLPLGTVSEGAPLRVTDAAIEPV